MEFGAQQAVLVFSADDQQRMKDIFDRWNVLTIEDCKGLEFHDVLLLSKRWLARCLRVECCGNVQ